MFSSGSKLNTAVSLRNACYTVNTLHIPRAPGGRAFGFAAAEEN